jgi:cell shape-determining protein MreC
MPGDKLPDRPAGGAGRQQQLRRLQAALGRFRDRLAHVRQDVRVLEALEARRPLTPAEAQQARRLRWESESLRLELERLRAEFAEVASRQRERGVA